MSNILIRGLDESIVQKLNQMSEEKGISREELCRNILKSATLELELKSQENKYIMLVESLADIIHRNTDAIEKWEYMMSTLLEDED